MDGSTVVMGACGVNKLVLHLWCFTLWGEQLELHKKGCSEEQSLSAVQHW